MRHLLPLCALSLAGFAAAPASVEAGQFHRRAAPNPAITTLPPGMPYRDPRPRFRAPPVERFAVRAYVPRPTNQPMFNEPPQPLR
ncbi:hypothetical protein [Methylobacterium sp. R2-1]|uniref:hypothetical protein n=1 Tax=Methylobacterium sp. R2-1 TaxID=2587064 RepID=UPI00161E2D6C|nr:hypothetical protein [Methylobacterium sp. R2-1]MBB2961210.1 hypothetical protein [Methylobacterium sp. R2-1]